MFLSAEEEELLGFLLGSSEPQRALAALTSGSTPDLSALERMAIALDYLYQGTAQGRLRSSMQPTAGDVTAARRLVELVRAGGPQEEIAAVARSVLDTLTPRSLPTLTAEEIAHAMLTRLRAEAFELTEEDARDVRRYAELSAVARQQPRGTEMDPELVALSDALVERGILRG